MNMRFMKQRKISTNTDESGQSRKYSSATNPSNARTKSKDARTKSKDSVNTMSKGAISRKSNVANMVSNSTEATLIGRRSFRGFNVPIERIWKDS